MKIIKKIKFFDKKGLTYSWEPNKFLRTPKEIDQFIKELNKARNKYLKKS